MSSTIVLQFETGIDGVIKACEHLTTQYALLSTHYSLIESPVAQPG